MIKAYLFDMDGTLANSEVHYLQGTKEILKMGNKEISTEELMQYMPGVATDKTFEFIGSILKVDKIKAKEIFNNYFLEHKFDYKDYVFKESFIVIKELKKRGYKLALCSNNRNENMNNFLNLGFREYFDFIVNPYLYPIKQKPDPDIYLKAMKLLNLKPDECIVIEDSTGGIKAAKDSGAYVIGTCQSKLNADISQADHIISNLIELIQ